MRILITIDTKTKVSRAKLLILVKATNLISYLRLLGKLEFYKKFLQ